MSRPEVAVGAVCVHADALLLVRRGRGPAAGEWAVPGGRVEWGETLHEAVVREIAEETGITIEPVALAGQREFITLDDAGKVSRHFVIL